MQISKKYQWILVVLIGLTVAGLALAAGEDAGTTGIGGLATKVTGTLTSVGKLMVAIAYLAGFGFLMFGILKFKQHKDNPQQVTLGVPIVMTIIGAVLLFVGSFIAPLGESLGVKPEENKFSLPSAT